MPCHSRQGSWAGPAAQHALQRHPAQRQGPPTHWRPRHTHASQSHTRLALHPPRTINMLLESSGTMGIARAAPHAPHQRQGPLRQAHSRKQAAQGLPTHRGRAAQRRRCLHICKVTAGRRAVPGPAPCRAVPPAHSCCQEASQVHNQSEHGMQGPSKAAQHGSKAGRQHTARPAAPLRTASAEGPSRGPQATNSGAAGRPARAVPALAGALAVM